MTHQEFISLLKSSKKINPEYIPDLKELINHYPYFTLAHLLYLKALQQSDDINYDKELGRTVLYVKNRRWLYEYISIENKKNTFQRKETKSGDYFDIVSAVEEKGGDVNRSLAELAKRLKNARSVIAETDNKEQKADTFKPVKQYQEPQTEIETDNNIHYEEKIQWLMKQKKYEEALTILRDLNLNNPKKNVYFADQIRFLEKIVENLKK